MLLFYVVKWVMKWFMEVQTTAKLVSGHSQTTALLPSVQGTGKKGRFGVTVRTSRSIIVSLSTCGDQVKSGVTRWDLDWNVTRGSDRGKLQPYGV
jgi:hypothetical protein